MGTSPCTGLEQAMLGHSSGWVPGVGKKAGCFFKPRMPTILVDGENGEIQLIIMEFSVNGRVRIVVKETPDSLVATKHRSPGGLIAFLETCVGLPAICLP